MLKILFVCHGNICRSPMAEYVFRDLAEKRGASARFSAASRATSTEELGNPVHRGTAKKLAEHGISAATHRAIQLKRSDYGEYDLLLCMDSANVRNTLRIVGADADGKVRKLLEYAGESGDIADPWYTGDFDETYDDVLRGCTALLDFLMK
ncbi:MAG: low molecular weight phosphotyrosine protein phosphatase [Bacteroides sp.]|nr:low molecular weight phosphotyrosine protein phosphatase [Eubacterium sp.]MCM1463354.1 low molecular weight phosphotyrosine protein phosphatase [Bacteroides sp.]